MEARISDSPKNSLLLNGKAGWESPCSDLRAQNFTPHLEPSRLAIVEHQDLSEASGLSSPILFFNYGCAENTKGH